MLLLRRLDQLIKNMKLVVVVRRLGDLVGRWHIVGALL